MINRSLVTVPHQQGIKVLQMIWGAMVFSVFVYGLIAWFVPVKAMVGGVRGPLVAVLGAVSVVLFLVQIRLNRNLADERLFPRVLDLDSWGLRSEAAGQLKELQVPERGVQLILQAHVIFGIVIWAMAEAVAVFGLFLYLLTGDTRMTILFGAASLAALFTFRPRKEAFQEQIRRWYRYVEMKGGRNPEFRIQNSEEC